LAVVCILSIGISLPVISAQVQCEECGTGQYKWHFHGYANCSGTTPDPGNTNEESESSYYLQTSYYIHKHYWIDKYSGDYCW
jgi:hypothetical protein